MQAQLWTKAERPEWERRHAHVCVRESVCSPRWRSMVERDTRLIPGTKREGRAEERGMGEEGWDRAGEGLERQTDGSGLEEDRQTDRREAQGVRQRVTGSGLMRRQLCWRGFEDHERLRQTEEGETKKLRVWRPSAAGELFRQSDWCSPSWLSRYFEVLEWSKSRSSQNLLKKKKKRKRRNIRMMKPEQLRKVYESNLKMEQVSKKSPCIDWYWFYTGTSKQNNILPQCKSVWFDIKKGWKKFHFIHTSKLPHAMSILCRV